VNVELEHSRSYLQREMAAAEARIHTLQARLQDDDNVSQVRRQDSPARMLIDFHSMCMAICSSAITGLTVSVAYSCMLAMSFAALFALD
jgi:uncharacterized membrane protein